MVDPKLAALRQKLDRIDTTMIELLRERAEIVKDVAATKGKRKLYIMPGREITMMESLFDKAGAALPKGFVWRLWREIIAHFTLEEGKLSLAVEKSVWDFARDHYGPRTPLTEKDSAADALHSLLAEEHQVGALPFPQEGESAPWWPRLLSAPSYKIFALLPHLPGGNAKGPAQGALALAQLAPDPTGRDVTFLAAKLAAPLSPEKLALPGKILSVISYLSPEHGPLALLQMDGFMSEGDVNALPAQGGVTSFHHLGGYGVPSFVS